MCDYRPKNPATVTFAGKLRKLGSGISTDFAVKIDCMEPLRKFGDVDQVVLTSSSVEAVERYAFVVVGRGGGGNGNPENGVNVFEHQAR